MKIQGVLADYETIEAAPPLDEVEKYLLKQIAKMKGTALKAEAKPNAPDYVVVWTTFREMEPPEADVHFLFLQYPDAVHQWRAKGCFALGVRSKEDVDFYVKTFKFI